LNSDCTVYIWSGIKLMTINYSDLCLLMVIGYEWFSTGNIEAVAAS
jgi:hypothetical protein